MSANVLKAIAVAAELTRAELSPVSLKAMADDLSAYPEPVVLNALMLCRRELDRPLTLKAVLDRVHSADGRPDGDEAWAVVIRAADESETVVWTVEMEKAWAISRPIFETRDKTGARVAFRDAYERLCKDARNARIPVKWFVSAGWDGNKRVEAVSAAVSAGYLTQERATQMLPAPKDEGVVGRVLLGKPTPEDIESAPEIVSRCQGLMAVLRCPAQQEAA